MELDNSVVNLIKAISKVESGGNINAVGASGEGGSYQFLPSTWNESAKKYGINVPLEQATAGQQNAVAYNIVKEWKDKGYNVTQIASMWNAGSGRPNAFKENWRGVNDKGVAYDTPAYVAKVAQEYVNFKNITPATQSTSGKEYVQDPNNANASIIKPEEVNDSDMYITGSDGYTIKNPNYDPNSKKNTGIVQSLVQDISQPFIRQGVTGYNLLVSVPHIISAISAHISGDKEKFLEEVKLADTSNIEEKVYDTGYFGKTSPTLDSLEQYGDLITIGSWFLPIAKVGTVAKTTEKLGAIATEKALQKTSKEVLIETAKKSIPFFAQGFTYGAGDKLSDGGSVQEAIMNGIFIGTATAGIGAAINTLVSKAFTSITSRLESKAYKQYDPIMETLFNPDGSRIINEETNAIWKSFETQLKKSASKAFKEFIDFKSSSGVNPTDLILFAINHKLGLVFTGAKAIKKTIPVINEFIKSPWLRREYMNILFDSLTIAE